MQFFTQMMHVPAAFAFRAIMVEFADGLGLIIGLLGRVAALGIFLTTIVAVAMVHSKIRFFMNWSRQQKGEGFEYDLFALTRLSQLDAEMGYFSGEMGRQGA
jgi:putative oxidoreductase